MGDVEGASRWSQEMIAASLPHDRASYTTLIRSFAKRGEVSEALTWLGKMMESGIHGVEAFNSVLNACAVARDLATASSVLDAMRATHMTPDVVSYTSMISCCANATPDAAVDVFHSMVNLQVTADVGCYTSISRGFATKGYMEEARHWLGRVTQAGLRPDAVTYSSMISCCDDPEEAWMWLNEMRPSGLKPNVVAFSAVIKTCATVGDWRRAFETLTTMLANHVQPNAVTWTSLLECCAQASPKRSDDAEVFFFR